MIRPPPEAFERATFEHAAEFAGRRREELRRASERSHRLVWAAAAFVVLGLHVAIVLVLTRRETVPPAPPQMPAAVMITLAPVAVTAKSEVDNLKNGPPADANTPAEAAPSEEPPPPPPAVEPNVDAPPPPPDVKPQAALPPKPPEKVEDRKRKADLEKEREKERLRKIERDKLRKKIEAEKREKREREQRASQAGGGPRSDRQTANVTAAAAAGSAVSESSKATWLNEIRAKIVRAKRFPAEARGQTGVSVVSVTFGATGGVSGATLVRSSGNAALDAEAVAVMSRAAPYPPPPGGKPTTLAIPLNFRR